MHEELSHSLFWAVHQGLPREGPGSDDATRKAFSMLKGLPLNPAILDIGCGPGAQTMALAQAGEAQVTAVDTHQLFLDELARRAADAGVADRVKTCRMSMFELDFDQLFDVLWSEGAIYIIGFEAGLRLWRPLLKPGGYAAVTEISWLKPDIPAEAAHFWAAAYPAMADVAENLARLSRAGYRVIGHFTLPESAWWQNYYHPMAERIAQLRLVYEGNPQAQHILDDEFSEIDLYRKYSDYYGYVFYIMQAL